MGRSVGLERAGGQPYRGTEDDDEDEDEHEHDLGGIQYGVRSSAFTWFQRGKAECGMVSRTARTE